MKNQLKNTKFEPKDLELGTRKVSNMNFSKIVTLPKLFTQNYLSESMEVSMSMSHDGKLTLTPIKTKKEMKEVE